jgi:hypothetical protein
MFIAKIFSASGVRVKKIARVLRHFGHVIQKILRPLKSLQTVVAAAAPAGVAHLRCFRSLLVTEALRRFL